MTEKEKIFSAIRRAPGPLWCRAIAKMAKTNYNTTRRVLVELWNAGKVTCTSKGYAARKTMARRGK